ncbi:hypothetical protein Droror1_Dr00025305, partial [Drosera rotundifolia]
MISPFVIGLSLTLQPRRIRTSFQSYGCPQHQVIGEFLDLFVAGTDTVSKTLEWAMAELLHNPNKWKKARAELNDVIGKGNHISDTHI